MALIELVVARQREVGVVGRMVDVVKGGGAAVRQRVRGDARETGQVRAAGGGE